MLDLLVLVARRKSTIDLCRRLGLEDKMPDLKVQHRVKGGKEPLTTNSQELVALQETIRSFFIFSEVIRPKKKRKNGTSIEQMVKWMKPMRTIK
ncbi:hypothetical protein HPP92_005806 [Vanilla planifolia]|uniref:Uncharacterized protein n=1 Tax=Vanilla planifolia TaxID=51239 RepID=A0A835VDJ3_VANPL|nr:hypothetical protein HPP92_005806 [Vanilla planifolia]